MRNREHVRQFSLQSEMLEGKTISTYIQHFSYFCCATITFATYTARLRHNVLQGDVFIQYKHTVYLLHA